MSSPHSPPRAIGWQTIRKAAAQGELARLEDLSEEEIDQELREAGFDAGEADRMVQTALAKTADAKAPARGRRSPMWWAKVSGGIAAAAAVAVFVRVLGREWPGPGAGVPEEVLLRQDARIACAKREWDECEKKLNEAKAIDPEGEKDPRVVEERKAIAGRGK